MINKSKQILTALALTAVLVLCTACTDASASKFKSFGNKCKVDLYSGGVLVKSWTSSGAVENEEQSDGFYFRDSETGKLIRIAGTVVVTEN